jgi:hypothetical protein
MKKNNILNCTHPVPKNKYGILAVHCKDNQAIDPKDMMAIIDGPISAAEPALQAEIAKPLDLRKATA